jgi:chorismate lyase
MHRVSWGPLPAHQGVPSFLRAWLSDQTSLTARIRARCGKFYVQVLNDGLALPLEAERRPIGLRQGQYAWVREVLLHADGRPVVFAHSVAAPRDLNGPWRLAAGIGGRPLGAALFADPGIRRAPLSVARMAMASPLHRRAETAVNAKLPALWARRSCFMRDGRPLMVTEVFLPGISALG